LALSRPGAGGGGGPNDRRLDNEIGGLADQQQVLDVVAANEDEPVAMIDRYAVDNAQPGSAAPGAAGTSVAIVAAEQPVADAGQDQNEYQDHEELGHDRSTFAEYRFQHLTPPVRPTRTGFPDASGPTCSYRIAKAEKSGNSSIMPRKICCGPRISQLCIAEMGARKH